MKLAILLAACTALGCTHVLDDPRAANANLAYVTETILAPNCGTAECHSTFKREATDVFDHVAGAQATFDAHPELLGTCVTAAGCESLGSAAFYGSYLVEVLTASDVEGDQMPLDEPLPDRDIQFITQWIVDGADGYVRPDAGTP